jgi:hypothetical protein
VHDKPFNRSWHIQAWVLKARRNIKRIQIKRKTFSDTFYECFFAGPAPQKGLVRVMRRKCPQLLIVGGR